MWYHFIVLAEWAREGIKNRTAKIKEKKNEKANNVVWDINRAGNRYAVVG